MPVMSLHTPAKLKPGHHPHLTIGKVDVYAMLPGRVAVGAAGGGTDPAFAAAAGVAEAAGARGAAVATGIPAVAMSASDAGGVNAAGEMLATGTMVPA